MVPHLRYCLYELHNLVKVLTAANFTCDHM